MSVSSLSNNLLTTPYQPLPIMPISAVALTALVTDHWLTPTGAALPFVKHAGLWKVCFAGSATESEGRAVSDVATFDEIKNWWQTVDDSFLEVADENDQKLKSGCTRKVAELYAHIWSNDFVVWLQTIRVFCVLFLWCGFLKILVVSRTYVSSTQGRWLSSAFAVFLAILQIAFGEVAWFLVLSIIQIAMRDAPGFLDRGTFASYEGWSFWAFFAAVQWCFLVTSLYLFVEALGCCVDERRHRFGVFGRRNARYVKMCPSPQHSNGKRDMHATHAQPRHQTHDQRASFSGNTGKMPQHMLAHDSQQ